MADEDTALLQGWTSYKARFVSPEGRVIDDANGGISHSEGQGYGMLLAVAADDGLMFARIWGWTSRELCRREDGLASWRWSPTAKPHLTDLNNATDGDLLIAWALARAAQRWHSPDYAAAARAIALAVGRKATFQSSYGLALKPGVTGFDAAQMADGPVVNLSYWVFPAFPALAEIAPEVDWAALTKSGLALLAAARFGPVDLPSEWISLKTAPAPAKAFPASFGYNGVRIPLYLVWGGQASPDNLAPFLHLVRDGAPPKVVDLATGVATQPFYDQGYTALFALAACSTGSSDGPPMPQPIGMERYYSTTLRLLTLVAAEDRGLTCG
jgi:endoglucanase